MTTYSQLLLSVLPVFMLGLVGWAASRFGLLKQESEQSIASLVIKILYPCMVFKFALGNPAVESFRNLIIAPITGFLCIIVGIVFALYVGKLIKIPAGPTRRTFGFTTGVFNYGYMAIPIASFLFDRETVGVLLIFNVGVDMAIWTVGVLLLTGKWSKDSWKRIFTPPAIALMIAIPMNLFNADDLIPGFVYTTIAKLGDSAITIAIVLIGATVQGILKSQVWAEHKRIPIAASLLRLGVLPVCFLLAAKVLPISTELMRVIAVQAAMPCGILPIVVAKHYGGCPKTAVRGILPTIVIGLLIIPLWLLIGISFLEL